MRTATKTQLFFSLLSLAALIGLAPAPAQALIEARASYTGLSSSPTDLNNNFATNPAAGALNGLGADLFLNLPIIPFGLGIRYEDLKMTGSNSVSAIATELTRTSILLDKRFIDVLGYYLGAIASFGVSNNYTYSVTPVSTGVATTYSANGGYSASLGVEAGINLLIVHVSAELGYMMANLGNLNAPSGTAITTSTGSNVAANLSGSFFRVGLGFGF